MFENQGGVKLVGLDSGNLDSLAGDTLDTSPGTVFDVAIKGSRVLAAVGGNLYRQPKVGFPFSRSFNVDTNGIATHVFTGYGPSAILEALDELVGAEP